MNLQQTLYERIIEWAMDVDPADCRREIAWRRRRFPNARPRDLAKGMLNEYSLASLAEGTLTALATGPLLAVPAAMVDAAFIMRAAARLNGCIGLMANPDYFATQAWRADVTTIIGDKPVAEQTMRRTAINVVNRTMVQVVTQRSVARFVPIIGGVVGGVWNFWELNRLGKRIFSYHFDDTLPNHHWPDEALANESDPDTRLTDVAPSMVRDAAPEPDDVETPPTVEDEVASESLVVQVDQNDQKEMAVPPTPAAEPTAADDSAKPAEQSAPDEAANEQEFLAPFSRLDDSDLAHIDRQPASDLGHEFEVDLHTAQPSIPVLVGTDDIEIEVLPSETDNSAGVSAGVRPSPLRKPMGNNARTVSGGVQKSEPVDTGTGRITSKRNASPRGKSR